MRVPLGEAGGGAEAARTEAEGERGAAIGGGGGFVVGFSFVGRRRRTCGTRGVSRRAARAEVDEVKKRHG